MKLSAPVKRGFERLEPYAGKLARTVLRGGWCSNALSLPDSGSLDPSPQDRHLTRTLYLLCSLMQIQLLDHLIIGDGSYSFADHGLMTDLQQECREMMEKLH